MPEIASVQAFIDAMQERAEQEMPTFIPQGIGNFVWALGTLGMEPSEGLLAAIMVLPRILHT